MLAEGRALEELEGHCLGCPANASPRAFGCYGYIQYPIEAATERFLLGLLPDDPSSTAAIVLARALADYGWNGEHTAKMRAQGDTFFELRDPVVVRWGTLMLSSDQLFQMVFGVGPIQPSHATMLALFFGMLDHETPP